MPIYEYLCRDCRKRSSILVLNIRASGPACCRQCGSTNVDRLLSRFAAPKSEEARLESLVDPTNLGDLDEHDPQSVARLMKKMGREMGEDLGEDMEAMLDEGGDEGETPADTDSV
ncbi:MAG TPA: zinc ribbon domain-containing protein [Nitrospira sp.]|jgi:putative FmdB family regulatory protein|nr:zinc ribbon domain-containing protein [Nitrospira sp.]